MSDTSVSSSLLGERTEDPLKLYSFEERLGSGNFGVVHRVVQLASGKEFACKLILKSTLTSSLAVEWVREEIKIMRCLAKYSHPNIVALEGVYEDQSSVYLVMELCNGGELYHYICGKEFLLEAEAAHIFSEVATAISFCHQNHILHRDVKPENILLHRQEGSPLHCHLDDVPAPQRVQVKLADFGLAVSLGSMGHTAGSAGSRHYEAPEVMGRESYGMKADSWSLGITLYAMLSGRLPFLAKNRESLLRAMCQGKLEMEKEPWPRVSMAAKSLVRRLLMVDPTRRLSVPAALSDPWLQAYGLSVSTTTPTLSPLPPHPPLPPRVHSSAPLANQVCEGVELGSLPASVTPRGTHILPRLPPLRNLTPFRPNHRVKPATPPSTSATTPSTTHASSSTVASVVSTMGSSSSCRGEDKAKLGASVSFCSWCLSQSMHGEEGPEEHTSRKGEGAAGGEGLYSFTFCCWGLRRKQRGGKITPLQH